MSKRLEGRDEPIIEAELPIIDTHHHLFHRPNMRYLLDDFLEDTNAGHTIAATVYVETQAMTRADGPEALRPLGEVEFANGVAAMSASGRYGDTRVCAAIVGYAQVSLGDAVAPLLDRAMATAPDRFRGVRQMTFTHPSEALARMIPNRFADGILASDSFKQGFAQVAARGLSFDATVFHTQFAEVAALADAFPDTTIILNHLGLAMGLGLDAAGLADLFKTWRAGLIELGRRPNIVCKIGGLGMPFWGFGFEKRTDVVGYAELAEAWAPYVAVGIEAFGPARCMMESNFPLEGISCGYVPLWNAMKHITRDYSKDERDMLFHGTAARYYRISAPGQ